jgi:K+ transporter
MADNRKTVVICRPFFGVICTHDETGPDGIKLTIGVRGVVYGYIGASYTIKECFHEK